MPSLLETIDRLSVSINSIKQKVHIERDENDGADSQTSRGGKSTRGPFSRALFNKDVQSVIRDAEDSEILLFTLEPGSDVAGDSGEGAVESAEVGRTVAVEATPLRKRRAKAKEPDSNAKESVEYDPEVYAEAAVRMIQRYLGQDAMPETRERAIYLLNRLEEVRSDIEGMQVTLREKSLQRPPSPRSQADTEQRRIRDLQSRIAQLKKRKELLLASQPSSPLSSPQGFAPQHSGPEQIGDTSSLLSADLPSEINNSIVASPSFRSSRRKSLPRSAIGRPRASALPVRASGGVFASQVGAGMDGSRVKSKMGPKKVVSKVGAERIEEEDRGDPETEFWTSDSGGKSEAALEAQSDRLNPDEPASNDSLALNSIPSSSSIPLLSSSAETAAQPEVMEESPMGEETNDDDIETPRASPRIVPSKLPQSNQLRPPVPVTDPTSEPGPSTPAQNQAQSQLRPPSSSKLGGIKITMEVEDIVAKVWRSLGDMLFPSKAKAGPLRAKETINLLLALTTLVPSLPPPSPSTISTLHSSPHLSSSDEPATTATPQQILTAHILLLLLGVQHISTTIEPGGPGVSEAAGSGKAKKGGLALQQVKDGVLERVRGSGGAEARTGTGTAMGEKDVTRALYNCIAKKLLLIDRSGGGQIVRFGV